MRCVDHPGQLSLGVVKFDTCLHGSATGLDGAEPLAVERLKEVPPGSDAANRQIRASLCGRVPL
jgi:hypothetical protein